jgi:hypothetical protein
MDNERAIAFERQQREKFARRFNRGPREYVTPTIARNSPLRPVSPSLPRNPTGMHEMNADNVCIINNFPINQLCIIMFLFSVALGG